MNLAKLLTMIDITVRAIGPGDWEGFAALWQRPKIYRETLGMPYPSAAAIRRRFENSSENKHRLVAIATETRQLVGIITLDQEHRHRRQHVGYIGISVHDDFHRQGIGSQLLNAALEIADNWLNLNRIELSVYVDNEPAVRLYQKFGFEIEGTLRKYAFRAGKYVDAYAMARVT